MMTRTSPPDAPITPAAAKTASTRRRYDRIAPLYDAMEGVAELRYRRWRRELWAAVRGPRVLELGVGTGKNMPFYPPDVQLTAIDLSPRMLARAQHRAERMHLSLDLRIGDAQALVEFEDSSFDDAVATFVFCSVPDAVLALTEVRRVLRPSGRVHLLEHVRARSDAIGRVMDLMNPISVRITGVNINRRTVENVRRAGLQLERITDLAPGGIFKHIVARAPERGRRDAVNG